MRRVPEVVSGDWLVNPKANCCYSFHRAPKRMKPYQFVFVDKWSRSSNGTFSQFKSRKELPLADALELCAQMLLDGWQQSPNQLGESFTEDSLEVLAA